MNSVDFLETCRLVKCVSGPEKEALVRKSCHSVIDRHKFYIYHAAEIKRLTNAVEKKYLLGKRTILLLHNRGEEKARQAFDTYMLKVGAHSIAAVQCLHAIPDIFAHVVYYSCSPNCLSKSKKFYFGDISDILKKEDRYNSLGQSLEVIKCGKDWFHLDGVANRGKHESIVRPIYNEDWTGSQPKKRVLQLSSFERDGEIFAVRGVLELLTTEHKRIMGNVVSIGNELNACLQRRQISPA